MNTEDRTTPLSEWREFDVRERLDELESYTRLSQAQRSELAALRGRMDEIASEKDRIRQLAEVPGGTEKLDNSKAGYGTVGASREMSANVAAGMRDFGPEAISRARRMVDECHRSQGLPDAGAEKVESLLVDGPMPRREQAARWATSVANPAYERAFAKLLADPAHAAVYLTEPERAAVAEARALAVGTPSAGGFAVPLSLDPTVVLTSDGSTNPVRQLARTQQIVGNTWQGVTSAGVQSTWYPEGTEVTDDSPALEGPEITTHRQSSFVPFSMEIGQDWAAMQTELRRLLLDAADQLDAEAFISGTGTGQPKGVVTALAGTASEVTTAGTGAVSLADVLALQAAVPPRFRLRGKWLANLSLIHQMSQMSLTTNGDSIITGDRDPRRMLGADLWEGSYLDGTVATGNNVLISGDWSGMVLVERLGATIELIPHVFGANQRPTGQRGLFLWRRVGADVINTNAFRMLTVG